ncbi:hypothetical protein QBC47DRAFT_397153 [Echria macrotheca]|uniref:Uncharacterized protein n=1 Tax=Echria macrotheca TaxID=438768 RepID=A0AAJ0BQB2_9PEZI|nr:hypothetical protein QBC47DRAFT_397153 [Echria macrotheca]
MSGYSKPPDPFSRRPVDDRRPIDSRDRRRESYGRSVSDSHDRYGDRGREGGSPPRQRASAYDPAREPSRYTNGPRNDAPGSRPTKSYAEGPSKVDGASCVASVGRALANWTKDIEPLLVEKAKIACHKEQLQKIQLQRKAEYQRTVKRHVDFPAIPELQNKYRIREDNDLKVYEAKERKVDERMLKLRETLPEELQQGLAAAEFQRADAKDVASHASVREVESKLAALKNTVQQHSDNTKRTLEALLTQSSDLETNHLQQKSSFKSEMSRQQEEFKSEMAKMRSEFFQELQKQREDLEKEQHSMLQTHGAKLEAQLAQQGASTKTMLEKQREEFSGGHKKVAASEVASLQKENVSLKSQIDALRLEVSAATERLKELEARVERQAQDAQHMRDSVASRQDEVEGLKTEVDTHRRKLMHMDTQIWDEMADASLFTLPKLKADFERLEQSYQQTAAKQEKLDGSPAPALTSQTEAFKKEADQFQLKIITRVGGFVDELRARDTAIENQVKDVQAKVASLRAATENKPSSSEAPNPEAINEIKRELSVVLQHVLKTDQDVQKASEEMAEKTKLLVLQFNSLQLQYQNLTTKELAQQIIGHLETIYPNSRQIVEDIGLLSVTTENLKKEQAEQAGEVKVAKQEVTELKRRVNDILLPTLKESADKGSKKRKIEDDAENSTNGRSRYPMLSSLRSLSRDESSRQGS